MNTYKKAQELAAQIAEQTKSFPRNSYYLVNLINKAASAISEQIAEGEAHPHVTDKKEYYWSARGAARRCAELIDVAARQGFIPGDTRFQISRELDQINSDIQEWIRISPQITEN